MPHFSSTVTTLPAPAPLTPEEETFREAVRAKDTPLVREMMEKGLRIDRQMGMGWHPLVLASTFGFGDIVEKLHSTGGIGEEYYHEALHACAGEGHRDVVYQILGYGFGSEPKGKFDIALAAMLGGHLDLLKEFMAKGFTTDLTCPVFMQGVIEHDHGHVLDFMLDHGADLKTAIGLFQSVTAKNTQGSFAHCLDVVNQWGKRDTVYVRAHGTAENVEDLRKTVNIGPGCPQTLFLELVKGSLFNAALRAVRAPQESRLEVSDLTATDAGGTSVIEILGAKGKLGLFISPEFWGNRPQELKALYEAVPPVYKDQVDMTAFVVDAHLSLLKKGQMKHNKFRI